MKLKESVKKGLFIFTVYLLSAVFIFVATDRVEKLENSTDNFNNDVSINYNK